MFPLKRGQTSLKTSRPVVKQAHTQFTMHGMGDYYGMGSKAPQGKMRDSSVGYRPVSAKGLRTPPRSVV